MTQALELDTGLNPTHSEITGSAKFEQAYLEAIRQLDTPRSRVWRGFMNSEARFKFLEHLRASANKANILAADAYQATTDPDIYFYYIYQRIIEKADTLMTYIVSSSQEPILQKKAQIAKYGTYDPKAYTIGIDTPLPVPETYRGSCPAVTIEQLYNLIPKTAEYLRSTDGQFFSTNRLATYLFDRAVAMPGVDGQTLKAKLFINVGDPSKYVAEVMPEDEAGGISCLENKRFEETNDPWYANSHHMSGPMLIPAVDTAKDIPVANPARYDSLKIVNGGSVIFICGIPKGINPHSLYDIDPTGTIQEGPEFLATLPKSSTPDQVLAAIRQLGLGELVEEAYR